MIEKIMRFIKDPVIRFGYLNKLGFYDEMEDEKFILKKGKIFLGYTPDLKNPKTFNEKLNYLKLNDRNMDYVFFIDKYEAKHAIGEVVGPEYVIPTLGLWGDTAHINWDALPKSFVIKCTHDSGSVFPVFDKSATDKEALFKKIDRAMKSSYFRDSREWPYKFIVPRILAEEMIYGDEGGIPKDYKLYIFNGVMRYLVICSNRGVKGKELAFNFYDEDLKPLRVSGGGAPYEWPAPEIPAQIGRMRDLAEKLAKDIPQVRVDMYVSGGHIYIGEMTFYDGGGFQPFEPAGFDLEMGEKLKV